MKGYYDELGYLVDEKKEVSEQALEYLVTVLESAIRDIEDCLAELEDVDDGRAEYVRERLEELEESLSAARDKARKALGLA